MAHRRKVLVFSAAGGSGRSYHADFDADESKPASTLLGRNLICGQRSSSGELDVRTVQIKHRPQSSD